MRPAAVGDGRVRAGLRRPAGVEAPGEDDARAKWERGEKVELHQLGCASLVGAGPLVVEDGSYFHHPCRVAGRCLGVNFDGGRSYLRLRLSGTLSEQLLKYCTGQPDEEVRGHVCPLDCNREEAADDLIHIKTIRQMKRIEEEEAWVQNLEKVQPMERRDELGDLRREMNAREAAVEQKDKKDRKERKSSPRGDQKVSKKEKKKEKKKRKKESAESIASGSEDKAKTDGSQAKRASIKKSQALFEGTGLDSREKVRSRVARLARRKMKKKSEKSGASSSGSADSSNSRHGTSGAEESLFDPASKVQMLAEQFPGALTCQAMAQMRQGLLQEIGHQDKPNTLNPVAVSYCRQNLMRRASGPVQRELLTLSHSLDMVLRGRAASAADTLTQRIKSIEHTILGSHWTVSQRLEVLPQDTMSITGLPEAKAAQREVYDESRLRWLSAGHEGRQPSKGGKGGGKGKGETRETGGKNQEGKGGKKSGGKGEAPKKKES